MTLYYRDVYDHIVRQYETVDSLRDLLTSAMDVYLSTVSNRLNKTTKALDRHREPVPAPELPDRFLRHELLVPDPVLEAPYWTFCRRRRHDGRLDRHPALLLPAPRLDLDS